MDKRIDVPFDSELCILGDTYYYRGTPPGQKRRVEKSLKIKIGATQKSVIEAKREFLERFAVIGDAKGDKKFRSLAKIYIAEREKEAENPEFLSQSTLNETRGLMTNHLIPYFGRYDVNEIGQIEFKAYCELGKIKKLNVVNHRKVLSHFLKWCVHNKHLRSHPKIEIPKSARKKRRERVALSDDQVKALVAASEGKILLYVLMYLFMGMRNMEICALRWDEVNLEKGELFVNPKNNRRRKARQIPINSHVLKLLQERRKEVTGEWVFPARIRAAKCPYWNPKGGVRKSWAKALATAGITERITPHDMRATFETWMHINPNFTDTQKEKMAGAKIDVQKDLYVKMQARQLKGLEESVAVDGVGEILNAKTTVQITGGKRGGKSQKSKMGSGAND